MANETIFSPVVDLLRQHQLLQQEYDHEKLFFEEQTRKAGIPRRVRQGLCWFPLKLGKTSYNSLNQVVVEMSREENDETEHLFEYGRPVCFFREKEDGQIIYSRFQGTVSYVQDNRMLVVVPSLEAAAELQSWVARVGVQLYFDGTSYQTMFAALKEVMAARTGRLAHLREVLLGTTAPGWRKLPAIRLAWLNPSQEKAVNKVLCAKDVAVVHGPPGTGKTTTLVEAVYETLRRETQVLVCAQSNTAVDWISEKLVDRGVNVLRVGNPTRVNEKMMSFTYEKRFEKHPSYPRLRSLRKAIREELARIKSSRGTKKEAARNHLQRLRQQAVDLEIEIDAQLFNEARVVACTLVGSANRLLLGKRFSTLFIDEAGQALEAACWIAITRSDRVVLAGDHLQLPPTIKCHEAARGGLDRTLLQRIQKKMPETVSMLTIQYRMHEDIMRFPSRWFYQNKLEAAPEVGGHGRPRTDGNASGRELRSAQQTGGRIAGDTIARIYRTHWNRTDSGRNHRLRPHFTLPRASAIHPPSHQTKPILQPDTPPHHHPHGGRIPGTGTGRDFHQPRAGKRKRRHRFPQRPPAHERGHDARPDETHHHRRRPHAHAPRILQSAVRVYNTKGKSHHRSSARDITPYFIVLNFFVTFL